MMQRDQIDDVVCEIMTREGPDRHVDGHDRITDFIVAIAEGRGDDWARQYAASVKKTKHEPKFIRWAL